jgi:hypothetical protein
MAGLGGRRRRLGFTSTLATAFVIGEPGIDVLGINISMAGLGGRTRFVGSMGFLATATWVKGEPGTFMLGFRFLLARLSGRTRRVGSKGFLATAFEEVSPARHKWASDAVWPGSTVASFIWVSKGTWRPYW